jgi:MFS transporter, YQGE family, putative transporter
MNVLKKIGRTYFDGNRNSGFVSLFVSKRLIQGAATALMSIFLPIFLYVTTDSSFKFVVGFYFMGSLLYVLFLAFATRLFNSIGYRLVLAIGMLFNAIFYAILYFTTEENIMLLAIPLIITLLLFRLFHWVPFQVDFTLFSDPGNRGREVSLVYATIAFMGVIGPILAGYIIATSDYQTLFGVVIVLLTLSALSYLFVPDTHEKYRWTYRETWRQLFDQKHKMTLFSLVANGAETTFTVVVWPIFIYELLDGNVLEVGAVSTFIVGITIALQLFLGRFIDRSKDSKHSALRIGSFFDAVGWIVKIFVISTVHVFFVGLYHNITKIFTKTSYNTIIYDTAADQGHYVDEFTVLREMAVHIGRVVALVIIGFITLFFPIQWTFVIGALAVLLLNTANVAARRR